MGAGVRDAFLPPMCVWIVYAFRLCRIVWKNMMEMGRGGAYVPAPTVSFGQIVRKRLISFGWIAREWLFCLCGMCGKI